MKPSEILKKAKEAIKDERHWTRGALARDDLGHAVHIDDSAATQFCMVGAVISINPKLTPEESRARHYLAKACEEILPRASIAFFNDSQSHKEVMRACDIAIKLAEKAGE
jgi:hypothetical protein